MSDKHQALQSLKRETREMGGTWISGRIGNFRIEALAFSEHADSELYELGKSKISRLWIKRLDTRKTTYNFDRGLDLEAQDEETQELVDFLASNLAA